MRANGLKITMPEQEQHVKVRAHHLCDVCTFQEPFDVVLLAVKAYDTRWACEMIKPHLAPNGMVIGMQNCMVADVIREVIGPERNIACVIELSSEMFTPGLVKRNTPPQKTWIGLGLLEGGPGHRLAEMQALLGPVGKVEIKDNILAAKWTKLVVNAMCLGPFAMVGSDAARRGEASRHARPDHRDRQRGDACGPGPRLSARTDLRARRRPTSPAPTAPPNCCSIRSPATSGRAAAATRCCRTS